MDYATVAALSANHPLLTALRKDWLPLAVAFLYDTYRRTHEVTVAQEIVRERLDLTLEAINGTLPAAERYQQDARYYIDRWSRQDDLIRIRLHESGYVVQLSPHAERLITWFETLQERRLIGTESRLRTIVTLLDEVVSQSTQDVGERLRQLHARRDEIDDEIQRIEQSQQVDSLRDVQIEERLAHISEIAGQLLRDFSLVEERFRRMALDIQQAQLDPTLRRGEILGSALDAEEQLHQSDEGQSFRAFYDLLTHPQQRARLDTLLDTVFSEGRLAALAGENSVLQRLTSHLLLAGEQVNRSNQRLAAHLRRVVESGNIAESRRVQALAGEIKYLVTKVADDSVTALNNRETFHKIEAEPAVTLPLERPLYDPPQRVADRPPPQAAHEAADDALLLDLFSAFYVDMQRLDENITRLLMSRTQATLEELVTSYPIENGAAELLGYIAIAARETRHEIDSSHTAQIEINLSGGEPRLVRLPRIVFHPYASG